MPSKLHGFVSLRDPSLKEKEEQIWHAVSDSFDKNQVALCGIRSKNNWPEKGYVVTCNKCIEIAIKQHVTLPNKSPSRK